MNTTSEHFTYKEFSFDMQNSEHEHAIWSIRPLTTSSNIIEFISSLNDDLVFAFMYAHRFHRTIVGMDQYCVSTMNKTVNSVSIGVGSTIIIYTSNTALGNFNFEATNGKLYKHCILSNSIEGSSVYGMSNIDVIYAKGYNIPNSMISLSFSTSKSMVADKYAYSYDEYVAELIQAIHTILYAVIKDMPKINNKIKFFVEEFEEGDRYQYSINCKFLGFDKWYIYAATPNTFMSYIIDECDVKDYNTQEFRVRMANYLSTPNSIILPFGSICKIRSINMTDNPREYFNEYLFNSEIILDNDCEIPVPLSPIMENVQNVYYTKKYKSFKSRKEKRDVLFISRVIPKYITINTNHPYYLIKYKQEDADNDDMIRHLERFLRIMSGGKIPFTEEFDEEFITYPISFMSYQLLIIFKKI